MPTVPTSPSTTSTRSSASTVTASSPAALAATASTVAGVVCPPLHQDQDGNAGPLFCSDGSPSPEALRYFFPLTPNVLGLPRQASVALIQEAICSDLGSGATLPIETSGLRLAVATKALTVPYDPVFFVPDTADTCPTAPATTTTTTTTTPATTSTTAGAPGIAALNCTQPNGNRDGQATATMNPANYPVDARVTFTTYYSDASQRQTSAQIVNGAATGTIPTLPPGAQWINTTAAYGNSGASCR